MVCSWAPNWHIQLYSWWPVIVTFFLSHFVSHLLTTFRKKFGQPYSLFCVTALQCRLYKTLFFLKLVSCPANQPICPLAFCLPPQYYPHNFLCLKKVKPWTTEVTTTTVFSFPSPSFKCFHQAAFWSYLVAASARTAVTGGDVDVHLTAVHTETVVILIVAWQHSAQWQGQEFLYSTIPVCTHVYTDTDTC